MLRMSIGPAYLRDERGEFLRGADGAYDFTAGLRRMREHGYTCLDLDTYANTAGELYAATDKDGFVATATRFRDLLSFEGLRVHQIHGPWVGDMLDRTPEERWEQEQALAAKLRRIATIAAGGAL